MFASLALTASLLGAADLSVSVVTETYAGHIQYDEGTREDPALTRLLRDAVDRSVTEWEAESAALATPSDPLDHRIDQQLMFRSDDLTSILREDFAYADGGHGTTWLIPVNWNAGTQDLIAIQDLFGERGDPRYDRLAAIVRDHVLDDHWGGQADGWESAIDAIVRPDPDYLSVYTFVPSTVPGKAGGLAWHFAPYDVAPGSDGIVTVTVPLAEIDEMISPAMRGYFAGQPAGDVYAERR